MKTYILLLAILLCLPVNAKDVKPSKPLAGQNSGHIDAPNTNTNNNNTYNSNQTLINSFAGDTSVMP